jgi:hypothetical protein
MSRKPPASYCLSRQHPELAKRSPAQNGRLGARKDAPSPPQPSTPEVAARKGL